MIGIFDSGHGGLTILRQLIKELPDEGFLYLGDHANAPYGNRPPEEVLALTVRCVDALFQRGCKLVILACNTASCVALREIQQKVLPKSQWKGRNVLGIVVPTVEAVTGVDWAVTEARHHRQGRVGIFGTLRTVTSKVYPIEINKRCPGLKVTQQPAPQLVAAVESGATAEQLEILVKRAITGLLSEGKAPENYILGCTHYDLVRGMFEKHLPQGTKIIHQPEAVAASLASYIKRHPEYRNEGAAKVQLLTTGNPADVSGRAQMFWPECGTFESLAAAHDVDHQGGGVVKSAARAV